MILAALILLPHTQFWLRLCRNDSQMCSEFCTTRGFEDDWANVCFFLLKVCSFRGITLERGIEAECADSVYVGKPHIEALLETDTSYYYSEGQRGCLINTK